MGEGREGRRKKGRGGDGKAGKGGEGEDGRRLPPPSEILNTPLITIVEKKGKESCLVPASKKKRWYSSPRIILPTVSGSKQVNCGSTSDLCNAKIRNVHVT